MQPGVGDKELEELLKPALQRVRQQQYINYLSYGLFCGLLLAALLLIISHFYLWSGAVYYALSALGLALLFSLLLARYFRPGIWQVASAVDAAGLKERITTALEFSGAEIDMVVRQRQDAIKHLRTFDCEGKLPRQFSLRQGQIIAGLLVLVLILAFWPNSHQAELANQIANKKEIARQEQKIAQVSKDLQQKNKELPAAQREKAIQDLEMLQKNLQQSGNLADALKALSQAEEKLGEARKTSASMSEQEMASLLAALRTQASTRPLAEKIARGDSQASQAEIDKLMKTSSPANGGEEAQALTRALEKAAASASSSPRAAQALQAMAGTANGAGARSSSARQDMNQQVAGWSSQAGAYNDINQALAAIQDARGAMLANNSAANSQLASSGSPSSSSSSGNNNESTGGGASGSGKSGSGAAQQGQGTGGSAGKGASGAGRGSSNGDSPRSSKASPHNMAGGLGQPELNVGEYEQIYAPERIGQAGESSYVKGEAGNGPQQMVDTDNPLTNSGNMRPYQEIIGHYSQAARDSLERSSIPAGKSELVKNYFSSLED